MLGASDIQRLFGTRQAGGRGVGIDLYLYVTRISYKTTWLYIPTDVKEKLVSIEIKKSQSSQVFRFNQLSDDVI